MILLNLLPPEEKMKIATQRALLRILSLGSVAFFCVLIFLVLLSAVWLHLSVQLKAFEDIIAQAETSQQHKSLKEFKNEVDAINSELQFLNNLKSKKNNYSFYVEKIVQISQRQVKFADLNISEGKMRLSGKIASREALVSFAQAIGASPHFEEPNIPIGNYLEQADFDFSITFPIEKEKKE